MVLARVEVSVLWDVSAHLIGGLDEIVAQVAIASFGHPSVLGVKVSGGGARPPKASDLGDRIFDVTQVTRTKALSLLVPLGTL